MVQAAITVSFTLSQGVKPVLPPRTELALLPDPSRVSSSVATCLISPGGWATLPIPISTDPWPKMYQEG